MRHVIIIFLSAKEFGFVNARSTVLQLLNVLDKWVEVLNRNQNNVEIIHMDFQKAFDKVPHQRLLKKL